MQICSKMREISNSRRDVGQSTKKWDCPAKIGKCVPFNLMGRNVKQSVIFKAILSLANALCMTKTRTV